MSEPDADLPAMGHPGCQGARAGARDGSMRRTLLVLIINIGFVIGGVWHGMAAPQRELRRKNKSSGI